MYRFRWRTAKPLKPVTILGCDNPTSRCQTTSSIGSLRSDKPVIPGVPFYSLSDNLFHSEPPDHYNRLFVPVRVVSLTVKQTLYYYAYQLVFNNLNLPFARLRYFLGGDRPSQTKNYTIVLQK